MLALLSVWWKRNITERAAAKPTSNEPNVVKSQTEAVQTGLKDVKDVGCQVDQYCQGMQKRLVDAECQTDDLDSSSWSDISWSPSSLRSDLHFDLLDLKTNSDGRVDVKIPGCPEKIAFPPPKFSWVQQPIDEGIDDQTEPEYEDI